MLDHDQIRAIIIMFEYGIGSFAAVVAVGAALYVLHEYYCGGNHHADRNLPRPKFDKDGNRILMDIDWD